MSEAIKPEPNSSMRKLSVKPINANLLAEYPESVVPAPPSHDRRDVNDVAESRVLHDRQSCMRHVNRARRS